MVRFLSLCLLTSCAAVPREIVLTEMENARIENVPVGVQTIQPARIWRQGQRISVDFATLLRVDPSTKTIHPEKVSAGDEIEIAKTKWSVVRVEPGTSDTRGRVLLRSID